jgi:hypothetical protein
MITGNYIIIKCFIVIYLVEYFSTTLWNTYWYIVCTKAMCRCFYLRWNNGHGQINVDISMDSTIYSNMYVKVSINYHCKVHMGDHNASMYRHKFFELNPVVSLFYFVIIHCFVCIIGPLNDSFNIYFHQMSNVWFSLIDIRCCRTGRRLECFKLLDYISQGINVDKPPLIIHSGAPCLCA